MSVFHLHTNCKHRDTCLTMFPGQLHHQEPINPNGQISSSVLVKAAWELYFPSSSALWLSLIQMLRYYAMNHTDVMCSLAMVRFML